MGYFSNGNEQMQYSQEYCLRCVHDGDCTIWDIHMVFNHEQSGEKRIVMDLLIPRKKLSNDQCKMFIQVKSKGQTEF